MTARTPAEAQVSLDRFWSVTGDARLRPPGRYAEPDELVDGQRPAWPSVGDLAAAEVLMDLPAVAYPATIEVTRHVDERASVAFRGNRYSLSPGMTGTELTLRHRLGTGTSGGLLARRGATGQPSPGPPGSRPDGAHGRAPRRVGGGGARPVLLRPAL